VTNAATTPKAANHGAKTTPTTPTVAGISIKVFPPSSLTITRVTFPSCNNSLTRSTKLLPETVNSSLVNLGTVDPQTAQNLSPSFNRAPHLTQKGKIIHQTRTHTTENKNFVFQAKTIQTGRDTNRMNNY
jgi:hypothetical protein